MVRLATPVAGASSSAGLAVASPRAGRAAPARPVIALTCWAPLARPAGAGVDCWARAPDRVAARPAPVTAGADQPGRIESPGRTAGRSCVERWITDGNWPRPAEGSPLEPSADGIDATAASPDLRCPAGWPAEAAGGSGCPSEPCATDRLRAAAGSRPGSATERRIGCRKLARLSGVPDTDQAGEPTACPDRTSASLVLGLAGSGTACLPGAGSARWAEVGIAESPAVAAECAAVDDPASSDGVDGAGPERAPAKALPAAGVRRTASVPAAVLGCPPLTVGWTAGAVRGGWLGAFDWLDESDWLGESDWLTGPGERPGSAWPC